jgi:uncharacterized membrane protein YdjX (TVP38/TMEM64 family)
MNYVLAFTSIPVKRYVLLTGISRIAIILILVFLGSLFNVQEHPLNVLWILIAYTLLFCLGYLFKKLLARSRT